MSRDVEIVSDFCLRYNVIDMPGSVAKDIKSPYVERILLNELTYESCSH